MLTRKQNELLTYLISEIENQFSITMETDDIIDFSSFDKGIVILKKYKIDVK